MCATVPKQWGKKILQAVKSTSTYCHINGERDPRDQLDHRRCQQKRDIPKQRLLSVTTSFFFQGNSKYHHLSLRNCHHTTDWKMVELGFLSCHVCVRELKQEKWFNVMPTSTRPRNARVQIAKISTWRMGRLRTSPRSAKSLQAVYCARRRRRTTIAIQAVEGAKCAKPQQQRKLKKHGSEATRS